MSEEERIKGNNGRKTLVAVFAAAILIVSVMPFIFSDDSNASDGTDTTLGAGSAAPAISAGTSHTLALKGDGTVWAWGNNSNGRLGDGTTVQRLTPVQVSSLTGVTAIAAGSHSLALKSDGTVWAWGGNGNGQLGNNTTIGSPTPVQVSSLTDISSVDAGANHSLALKSDGTVWAWGFNNHGQLGDGTNTDHLIPVQVSSLTDVTAISGGGYRSFALKSDGTMWAWGSNGSGQLGDGTSGTGADKSTPVQVKASADTVLTDVTTISGGESHTLALKSNGTVWAWGANYDGQLGNDSKVSSSIPVEIMSLAIEDDSGGLSTVIIIAIAVAVIVVIIIAAWALFTKK